MTELTDLNDTDALNTEVTSQSTEGNVANMGNMDNLFQATLGMLSRFRNANIFRLRDNTDKTKLLAFDLSGITTATTRTLTAPDASGTVMLTSTAVANAQVLTGSVVQSAYAADPASANFTTVIPVDDTLPLISEGTELISIVGFTPRSATNRIRVRFNGWGSAGELNGIVAAIFAGSTCLTVAQETVEVAGYRRHVDVIAEYVPGSVSPITFVVRVGPATTGTIRFNGTVSGGRLFGGAARVTFIVEEIKA